MAETKKVCADLGGDLSSIPDNIGVSYLPRHKSLAKNSLTKGLRNYKQNYVHDFKIFSLENGLQVSAKCWRSMRKTKAPHSIKVEISTRQEEVTESFCTCQAGQNGRCSHVVGLLKTLQGYKLHNYKVVPDLPSCTSLPQQWHIPRGMKIQPVPINHVVVAKAAETRKRRPVLCQVDTKSELPSVTETDLQTLKNLKGTPLEYMVSSNLPTISCPLGEVQLGSLLSYQCKPWRKRACCTSNTTSLFHSNPTWLNFNWNHCPGYTMSSQCRKWFLRDLCFYECSPNAGPWIVPLVGHKRGSERFLNVPLCQSECQSWWNDCKDEYTCLPNWGKGFNWTTGTNICPSGSRCRPFAAIFGNASSFCGNVWDGSWKAVPDSQPCLKIHFTGNNPNEAVARQYTSHAIRQRPHFSLLSLATVLAYLFHKSYMLQV